MSESPLLVGPDPDCPVCYTEDSSVTPTIPCIIHDKIFDGSTYTWWWREPLQVCQCLPTDPLPASTEWVNKGVKL